LSIVFGGFSKKNFQKFVVVRAPDQKNYMNGGFATMVKNPKMVPQCCLDLEAAKRGIDSLEKMNISLIRIFGYTKLLPHKSIQLK
jgi:hypothetical protein